MPLRESPRARRILWIALAILLIPVVLVAAAVGVVQSEWGERWVENRLSAQLKREVQLEDVSLRWGWPPGVTLARLRIGNPEWAKTPNLIDAEGLYARVAVAPLFKGLIVLPYLGANKASAGLEMDGKRATWRFGPASDEPSRLVLTRIYLEDGRIAFIDKNENTEMEVLAKGSAGEGGVLNAEAKGRFRGEALKASARLPGLNTQDEAPVRFEGKASVGKTEAVADGWLATDGKSLDFNLTLAGDTFKTLSKLTGMVLPDSPPYKLAGRLKHANNEWVFENFKGRVGDSDLSGDLTYEKRAKPFLKAKLRSNLLDFDDLGPLIGAPPKTGPGETAASHQKAKAAEKQASTRILPDTEFGTGAWGKMDADVFLDAKRVQRPKQLPITALQAHLVLKDGVVHLLPLNFVMADGRFTTDVTLDARQKPLRGVVKGDVQGLKLKQLFPDLKSMQDALGTLYGRIDVTGHGYSVAALLGSSNGKASFAVDGGRVSLLLIELLGLDVAEAVMLLGARHRQTELRCAVSGFEVKDGVMSAQDFVVDTNDTVVKVEGSIDLKNERIDLETKPEPKDPSPLALRTPINLKGPIRDPSVRPKPGPLAARAAGAIALGAVNPALALLALIETGPGKDTDCARLLSEARQKGAVKKQN